MSRIITKFVSVILLVTFLSGQVFAGEVYQVSSNDTLATFSKLAAGSADRGDFQSDVSGMAKPGAIANGEALNDLAQWKFPPRIETLEQEAAKTIIPKLAAAVRLARELTAQKLSSLKDPVIVKYDSKDRSAIRSILTRLDILSEKLDLASRSGNPALALEAMYLFNAVVKGPENYNLGFNYMKNMPTPSIDKDFMPALSVEAIQKLSVRRLAQYIFHEFVREHDILSLVTSGTSEHMYSRTDKRDIHRMIYNEIQGAIFGAEEVEGLKDALGDLIAEKLWPELDPESLTSDKRIVMFISGGESAGVNDYFANMARRAARYGYSVEVVNYGFDSLVKPTSEFMQNRVWVTKELKDRIAGMPGAAVGTARVHLKDEKSMRQAVGNLKGYCNTVIIIGGNDHIGQANELAKQFTPEDNMVVIALPKTIDRDTKDYPVGADSAGRQAHETVVSAAQLPGSKACTIVQMMGRDMGALTVRAGDMKPEDLSGYTNAQKRKMEMVAPTMVVAVPEYSVNQKTGKVVVSLSDIVSAVRERMKKYGTANVVISEGFRAYWINPATKKMEYIDPLLKEVLDANPRLKAKLDNLGRDASGNLKLSELGIADFLAEVLAMELPEYGFKTDENLFIEDYGYGLRARQPDELDKAVAEAATKVAISWIIDAAKRLDIINRHGVEMAADRTLRRKEDIRIAVKDIKDATGTVDLTNIGLYTQEELRRKNVLGTGKLDLPDIKVAGQITQPAGKDMAEAIVLINSMSESALDMGRANICVVVGDEADNVVRLAANPTRAEGLLKGGALKAHQYVVSRTANRIITLPPLGIATAVRLGELVENAYGLYNTKIGTDKVQKMVNIVAPGNLPIVPDDEFLSIVKDEPAWKALIASAARDGKGNLIFGSRLAEVIYLALTSEAALKKLGIVTDKVKVMSGVRKNILNQSLNRSPVEEKANSARAAGDVRELPGKGAAEGVSKYESEIMSWLRKGRYDQLTAELLKMYKAYERATSDLHNTYRGSVDSQNKLLSNIAELKERLTTLCNVIKKTEEGKDYLNSDAFRAIQEPIRTYLSMNYGIAAHKAVEDEGAGDAELSKAIDYMQRLLPESSKFSKGQILDNLIVSNLNAPSRVTYTRNGKPHLLPPTFVFNGNVFPGYKGKDKPRFIVLTSLPKGVAITTVFSATQNERYILSKGGCRWYQVGQRVGEGDERIVSMDEKFRGNPKKNLDPLLPEGVRLAEAMSYKSPFWEVYFDGGKTIFMAEEDADKEQFVRDWVASSILAGSLMRLYIAGPDTYMSHTEMGWIEDEKMKVAGQFPGSIPSEKILATTSRNPEEVGTFPHEEWRATSIGVVETLVTALGNKALMETYNVDSSNLSVAIVGFGDVGGGVIKYLHDFHPDIFNMIKITLVADSKGAIHNPKGLDKEQLYRLVDERTRVGSAFALKDYYKGEFKLIPNTRDAYFTGATILIPAARGTFIRNEQDIADMAKAGTQIISEGANNFAAIGIEDRFEPNGIIYYYGPVANGGGIYSSKEEIFHAMMEGVDSMKAHMEERRLHIQGDIGDTALGNARWLSDQLAQGKGSSIYEIHQKVVRDIIRERSRLLDTPTESEAAELNARVEKDLARGVEHIDENIRLLTIVNATELAREKVMGANIDREQVIEDLDSTNLAMRRAAAYWAGKLRIQKAVDRLISILKTPTDNPSLRRLAAISLAYINSPKVLSELEEIERSGQAVGDVGVGVKWAIEYMAPSAARPALAVAPTLETTTRAVEESTNAVRVVLPTKDSRVERQDIAIIMKKELATAITGQKSAVLDETLRSQYRRMQQELRRTFTRENGIVEVENSEDLVNQANLLLSQNIKVIILDDGTLVPNEDFAIEGYSEDLYCVVSADSVKGLDSLTVPFVNLYAMAAMGVGILDKNMDLFQRAYVTFTGKEAPGALVEALREGLLRIVRALPRIFRFTNELGDQQKFKKLVDVAA